MTKTERNPDLYSFAIASETVDAFRALMKRHGVPLREDSLLERSASAVREVLERYSGKSGPSDNWTDRELLANLVGVTELARLLVRVQAHPDFPQLVPHLCLLNEGSSLQNLPSSQRDAATNKVFELMVAAMAMRFAGDIALEGPSEASSLEAQRLRRSVPRSAARGSNPDVLATVDGRRWGIACKAIHSVHPEGFMQHLEKGIDQIEVSPAEVGVVAFNLKNVIQHARYWPEDGGTGHIFEDASEPFAILHGEMLSLGRTLRDYLPQGYLESVFEGKKAVPGFLLWGHTTAVVRLGLEAVGTSVRTMVLLEPGKVSERDAEVLARLNDAAFDRCESESSRP